MEAGTGGGRLRLGWVHKNLAAKNKLIAADADLVEAGFEERLAAIEVASHSALRCLWSNADGSASHSFRPTARPRPQGQRRIHGPGLSPPSPHLHAYGDEASWWAAVSIDPLTIALELWRRSHPQNQGRDLDWPPTIPHIDDQPPSEPGIREASVRPTAQALTSQKR
jgi:hypothetical protein